MWADSDTVGLLGKHPADPPGPGYVEAEVWSWSTRGVNSPRMPLYGGGQSRQARGWVSAEERLWRGVRREPWEPGSSWYQRQGLMGTEGGGI